MQGLTPEHEDVDLPVTFIWVAWFKSVYRYRLSWLCFVVGFLRSLRQIPGQHLDYFTEIFVNIIFTLSFADDPIINTV